MKLNSWLETGLDGDVLFTTYVPKGIKGYDDVNLQLEFLITLISTSKKIDLNSNFPFA